MINGEWFAVWKKALSQARREADMALVYGLGFPPFHGGAFPLAGYAQGSAKHLDMAQRYQHTSARCMKCRKGCVIKRAQRTVLSPVEPARPVGSLATGVTMERVVIVVLFAPRWAVRRAARFATCGQKISARNA